VGHMSHVTRHTSHVTRHATLEKGWDRDLKRERQAVTQCAALQMKGKGGVSDGAWLTTTANNVAV